ncbi:MAG: GatB/YqeY domain-containing protein [Candidatus Paralactobacillus gallistercoris]|uniref:GatB/YqeY domain-containing protein n=1 Tax=Candidatus Paralactobacillus gallistercoris TaxID=2838724 RepID=A0A948TIK9_9LACO|nr:GatB/YqeY domain-containing protein [Candidatus Paralactobacillus gallistercoris]
MLLDTLNSDLVAAMKSKDKEKLAVLRMLKTALTNERIKLGHDLTSADEINVLSSQVKQRREAVTEFRQAGRDDLADQNEAEIKVIETYLPKQLSADEINALVDEVIKNVGATSKADFGKVMKTLMPQVKGKADGSLVKQVVQSKLN